MTGSSIGPGGFDGTPEDDDEELDPQEDKTF
jgi:hypothetical protein